MSINISLSFGGGLGVFVLGLLISAGASYSETYFQQPNGYTIPYLLGWFAMLVGLSLTIWTIYQHWLHN